MSDWMDLQLSHSLAKVKAPEELWARISGEGVAAANPPERVRFTVRWVVPCAIAATLLLLLVRATAMELRPPHEAFVANDRETVERALAHVPGRQPKELSAPVAQVASNTRSDAACKHCHNL